MDWLASRLQDSKPWSRQVNYMGFRGVPWNTPFFLFMNNDSLIFAIDSLRYSVDSLNGFLHVFLGFGATLAVGLMLVKLTLRGN